MRVTSRSHTFGAHSHLVLGVILEKTLDTAAGELISQSVSIHALGDRAAINFDISRIVNFVKIVRIQEFLCVAGRNDQGCKVAHSDPVQTSNVDASRARKDPKLEIQGAAIASKALHASGKASQGVTDL
jgi:hypothetical protein